MQGSGTLSNPYIISTPQDLHNVRNGLLSHYVLGNDIDMRSWGNFIPIGATNNAFRGTFNGNGKKIKNLIIQSTSGYVGLFLILNNASAKVLNVGIENCNIRGLNVNWVGSITGSLTNASIENCYSTGEISGHYMVGGVVGTFTSGLVQNCYSHAEITGAGRVGGLVGYIGSSNAKVENSFSTGRTFHTEVGTTFVSRGLIGNNLGINNVTNSYWDIETSGQTTSEGGIGKTTQEMKTQSTFLGWNFSNTWGIDGSYPYLQLFGVPSLPAKDEIVNVISHVGNVGTLPLIKKLSTKQTNTFIHSVQASQDFHMSVLRSLSSHTSNINTTVTQSDKAIKKRTYELTSYLYPVSSTVERKSNTYRVLLAHIKPITTDISVLYPLNDKLVMVTMEVLKNNSYALHEQGRSNFTLVENPSFMEVKE